MNRTIDVLVTLASTLTCALVFGQVTKTSIPQPNEDRYVTQDFGNCTFAYGKDRSQYIEPYVMCTAGREVFSLIPQEDGKWAILVSPGDETDRSEKSERTQTLAVTIRIDENDVHEFSMMWPGRMHIALKSFELPALYRLLHELRRGDSMIISRNNEEIEFDLTRANQAFLELIFEQWIALSKVESTDSR